MSQLVLRQLTVSDGLSVSFLGLSVPPGSLESQSKQELEQRLRSSMIMVEALVQQLASARLHSSAASTGPAPSDLRDQMVQTEHTELSQVCCIVVRVTTSCLNSRVHVLDCVKIIDFKLKDLESAAPAVVGSLESGPCVQVITYIVVCICCT